MPRPALSLLPHCGEKQEHGPPLLFFQNPLFRPCDSEASAALARLRRANSARPLDRPPPARAPARAGKPPRERSGARRGEGAGNGRAASLQGGARASTVGARSPSRTPSPASAQRFAAPARALAGNYIPAASGARPEGRVGARRRARVTFGADPARVQGRMERASTASAFRHGPELRRPRPRSAGVFGARTRALLARGGLVGAMH
jgi:hypothetical protein